MIIKTINLQGVQEIKDFLAENHKQGTDFTDEMLYAWAEDAEFQMGEGNPPCIEIKAQDCVHGRTVEYTISDSGVDTEEVEG